MNSPEESRAYPVPMNEQARLAELRSYGILNSPPELQYDRVVESVRKVFEVPMATISLVDDKVQWFKSECGIGVCETPRETSFCTHTILNTGVMVVENALLDPRFEHNPLVSGPPHLRFYAGAPLITPSGACIGSICAIDTKPRKVTQKQIEYLSTASKLVMRFLEGRRVLTESFKFGETLGNVVRRLASVDP